MLGSADLLGQMSDRAYLEKLLFLYKEFREAGIPGFNTEFDIIRKTVDFYEITVQRLRGPFAEAYGSPRTISKRDTRWTRTSTWKRFTAILPTSTESSRTSQPISGTN